VTGFVVAIGIVASLWLPPLALPARVLANRAAPAEFAAQRSRRAAAGERHRSDESGRQFPGAGAESVVTRWTSTSASVDSTGSTLCAYDADMTSRNTGQGNETL
jgi:hypothetical protein